MVMKLVGSCYICGAPAMNTCSFCGRLACRECFEVVSGSCAACRKKAIPDEDAGDEDIGRFRA